MPNEHREETPTQAGTLMPAADELARALHVHRIARGLSLRTLARRVGMSAHSGLVDYERGHRILPEDLAVACERALELPPGYLLALRRRALAELAEQRYPRPGRFAWSVGEATVTAAANTAAATTAAATATATAAKTATATAGTTAGTTAGATAGTTADASAGADSGTSVLGSVWADDLKAMAADVRHLAATAGAFSLRMAETARCWLAARQWSGRIPEFGYAGEAEEPGKADDPPA